MRVSMVSCRHEDFAPPAYLSALPFLLCRCLSSFVAFACGDSGSSGGGDGDGDGDTSGDGDGDGDTSGDGDGDTSGDGDGDTVCEPGSEGCACYGNSTCDGDLSCLSDTCVDAGGDGDGDGDMGGAPGDGDGDGTGGGSPEIECTRSAQCDDDDPCTDDACIDAVCVNDLIESSLCASGTCLADTFAASSSTSCLETESGEDLSICHTTTCTEGDIPGCDVDVELGDPSVESELNDDGSRTVTYTFPVVEYQMLADVLYGDSNCVLSMEVPESDPPTVTLMIVTAAADMCGGDEVVASRSVDADIDSLIFHFDEGEGESTACEAVELTLSDIDNIEVRNFRDNFEVFALNALGDLDELVTVGTMCGSCSGDCEGLSCAAPAAVE